MTGQAASRATTMMEWHGNPSGITSGDVCGTHPDRNSSRSMGPFWKRTGLHPSVKLPNAITQMDYVERAGARAVPAFSVAHRSCGVTQKATTSPLGDRRFLCSGCPGVGRDSRQVVQGGRAQGDPAGYATVLRMRGNRQASGVPASATRFARATVRSSYSEMLLSHCPPQVISVTASYPVIPSTSSAGGSRLLSCRTHSTS